MKQCSLFNNCNHKDCDKTYCARRDKVESIYKLSMLSPMQQIRIPLVLDANKSDLEAFQRLAAIEKDIGQFVKNGNNLYLHSRQCGNGKTSWAVRLLQAYTNFIWPFSDGNTCKVLFISVPKLLLALKDNIDSKNSYVSFIKENIDKADLVVWDDLAAKNCTEFEVNNLFTMIDNRIVSHKSNIYTSNLESIDISAALGERLASRVCNYSEEIILVGADKRKYSITREDDN